MEIICKNYEHYNRTLGKHIRSKKQYQDEMKRQGMVDWETGCRQADEFQAKNHKKYEISKDTESFLKEVKHSSKNGKVSLSDRQIDKMKDIGVKFDYYNTLPKHYSTKEGGFDNASN